MINEKRITVDSVPCLFVEPDDCVRGTVLFYHGWSSAKELQVLRARILAAYGYAVLVPDALYHGERGSIDYDMPSLVGLRPISETCIAFSMAFKMDTSQGEITMHLPS